MDGKRLLLETPQNAVGVGSGGKVFEGLFCTYVPIPESAAAWSRNLVVFFFSYVLPGEPEREDPGG